MTNKTKRIAAVLVALVLVAVSCITVFAADVDVPSPTGTRIIKVTVIKTEGCEGGSYKFETDFFQGPNGGTIVDLTAEPEDGYTLTDWEIEGEYDLHKGTLKDPELAIEAYTDIVATPIFSKNTEEPTAAATEAPTVKTNDGKTSPQTGNNTYAVIAFLAVLAASAGIIVVKRKINQ